MKKIKNLTEFCLLLQDKIDRALQEEVLKDTKKVMLKAINQEVYGKYTPNEYDRRLTNGGLGDEDNIIGDMVGTGKLSIMNITSPSKSVFGTPISSDAKTILSQWIEYGQVTNVFNYNDDYSWLQPRPFMKTTKEMLKTQGVIKKALIRGLRKQRMRIKG